MKATELRIGNFVTSTTSMLNGKTLIVTELNESHAQAWGVDSSHSHYGASDKFIIPIPLTEEWLLKFDWFSIDDDRYTFRDIEYYTISNEGSLYFSGDYTCTDIKYVHQLQNLYFALTGNELTIKL